MALVTTTPIRRSSPISADRLRVRSVTARAVIAPTTARGRLSTTTKGSRSDPRLATITRYTRTTPMPIARKTSWNPSSICSNIPPLSTFTPAGRARAAITWSTSAPTAWVSLAVICPWMLAERSRSNRLMLTGPCRMPMSLMDPSLTVPAGPEISRSFSWSRSCASSGWPRTTMSRVCSSMSAVVTSLPIMNRLTCRPTSKADSPYSAAA